MLAHGLVYAATVLAATSRPDPMFGPEGLLEVSLDLLVTPDDAPAYRTSCTVSATGETARFFVAGASLVLRVDPEDPSKQLVDVG